MPVSADTLALLVAAGLSGDALISVVRSIDSDMKAAQPVEKRRAASNAAAADRMARYRATRKASGLSLSFVAADHIPDLVRRDGGACVYCGSADDLTVDHFTPTSQGGSDDLDNLGIACRACNGGKSGRTPEQAQMKFICESAEDAHVRYCSGRTVRGERGEHIPPQVSPKRYNQTPSSPSTSSSLRSDDGAAAPKPKSSATEIKTILESVLSPELVAGVIEHRRKKGAPLTVIAAQGLVRDFAATGQPDDAARMMIERGWQGFKLDWWNNDRATKQPRAGPAPARSTTSQAFADLGAQLRNRRNEQPQGSIFSDEEARGAIIDAEPLTARS